MIGLKRIKKILVNHKKVAENYFFMTVLQFLNSFFYLLIYPYLIRTLGKDNYGIYVFAMSIVMYFVMFITFGFDTPSVKIIAEHPEDKEKNSQIVSAVFTSKLYLLGISIVIFFTMMQYIPFFRSNRLVYLFCFLFVLSNILLPVWYFQGVQKMGYVTIIQVIFKIISLGFIFTFVTGCDNVVTYAAIVSLSNILGGIAAMYILISKEKIHISLQPFGTIRNQIKQAFPFFLTLSAGTIRQQSTSVFIGVFFTMADVAIYDLAYKIITIPQAILSNISSALFPKVMKNYTIGYVKKLIQFQSILGILVILFIVFLGKYIVLLLGGETMYLSYYFAVILSVTVFSWLTVGGITNFLFVPQELYYTIFTNQLVAFITYFVVCLLGIFLFKNIFSVAIAMAIAGLSEIIYCYSIIKKYRLLCR